jgi:hypothetical protein
VVDSSLYIDTVIALAIAVCSSRVRWLNNWNMRSIDAPHNTWNTCFIPPEFHASHSLIDAWEPYISLAQLLYNSLGNVANYIAYCAFADAELVCE